MIRKPKIIDFWRGRLPHMQVEDGRYFVTIHLAGAIPAAASNRIRLLAKKMRQSPKGFEGEASLAIARKVFYAMERWLDRNVPEPLLVVPSVSEMILSSIEHRHQRQQWNVFDAVLMPNHLHFFFEIDNARSLKVELESFKRWTSTQANKLLSRSNRRFWQLEWFDHWSRSDEQDEKILRYIANNPVKAGLAITPESWPHRFLNRAVGQPCQG